MPSYTTRLGLTKPAGSDLRQITPLNDNFDSIDFNVGVTWINDGVVPPDTDMYDGKLYRENTSGQLFVCKASGGTFTMVKVTQPNQDWAFIGLSAITLTTATSTDLGSGLSYASGTIPNDSTGIQITSNKLVFNKNGYYTCLWSNTLSGGSATGAWRRITYVTGSPDSLFINNQRGIGGDDNDIWSFIFMVKVEASSGAQTVTVSGRQESGSNRTYSGNIRIVRSDIG